MVAQRCQILCVLLSMFSVFCWGGGGVSNFGHSRVLETPGGDLGFHGSILGPNIGRQSSFGAPILGWFLDAFGVCF